MRVLGIDPGTHNLGFGCIECVGQHLQTVAHGTIKLNAKEPLELRLQNIFEQLTDVVKKLKPDVMVVERVFFAKNALSALKLGHARGVVLLVAATNQVQVVEITPAEVKRMVAGSGRADKEQVAKMVQLILGKQSFQSLDASDALALALCHVYLDSPKQGSVRAIPKKSGRSHSLAHSLAHRINR